MEGSWHVHRTGQLWGSPRSGSGVRAVLANEEWTTVGHRLGMLDLVEALVGDLGPDVLGPGWDPGEVVRRLRAAPDRQVGEALLDQQVLAGIGAFYMAEALFLRGVSPWTPVEDAGDLEALVALLHRMLRVNARRAVQSTTGDLRPGRTRWVHARSGRECLRCGTGVRVAVIGLPARERTAFYCPRCQPGPAPTDDGRAQRPLGSPGSEGLRRR